MKEEKIKIIIQILECGGNLFDAVSMAVKAALFCTLIPKVSVTSVDGGEPELEVMSLFCFKLVIPGNVWLQSFEM